MGSMQSSYASIPEAPPSHAWHGYSHTMMTDMHEYVPHSVSSMVSFDSSTDMTLSSPFFMSESSDVWHTNDDVVNWDNDILSFEPLPLSSRDSFLVSNEMATSISELLSDDDDSD